MTADEPALSERFRGWDSYQELLVSMARPLDSADRELRAAPHLRRLGDISAHIVAGHAWWFHTDLGEGRSALMRYVRRDEPDRPPASATDLVTGLERTWALLQDCLARWHPSDLDVTFERGDARFTRSWEILHVLAHDMHHGGEMSLTLGLHGRPVPDLQRMDTACACHQ